MENFDAFVNEDILVPEGLGNWEEPYLGLPDTPDIDDHVDQSNAENQVNTYDSYVGAEVCIPDEKGQKLMARVSKRMKDSDGVAVGQHHENPFMDTSVYEVKYPDGSTAELQANIIAKNMLPYMHCLSTPSQ